MSKDFRRVALAFFWLSGGLSIALLCLFLFKTTEVNINYPIDTGIFADYGTLIGSIVGSVLSVAGILLLIQNINEQQINFQSQQQESEKKQIESRFFELLKVHRENSQHIWLLGEKENILRVLLVDEMTQCIRIVRNCTDSEKTRLGDNEKEHLKKIVDIAYQCFFYGVTGSPSSGILRNRLANYPKEFIQAVTTKLSDAQAGNYLNSWLFKGHQEELGHYYRHLFQTIKYIDSQPKRLLTYDEKYQYVKTLRAQLSTREQVLLFFNSLSELGKPWELDNALEIERRLITKYNLIKNIPFGYVNAYVPALEVNMFYPEVVYEGQEKDSNRLKLEGRYRKAN